MKFSASSEPNFDAPPTLGRDTQSVLADLLDYDCSRIDTLRLNRVIQ